MKISYLITIIIEIMYQKNIIKSSIKKTSFISYSLVSKIRHSPKIYLKKKATG